MRGGYVGIFSQTAGQIFLQDVVSVYDRSPLEIAVFLLLLFVPVAALVSYAVVARRREHKRAAERAEKAFQTACRKHELTPSRTALMEAIAQQGARPDQKHLVFEDESLFNRGVKSLAAFGSFADDSISALRLVLGFTRHGGVPISSVSLPAGSGIAIAIEGQPTVTAARVRSQKTQGMVIETENEWKALKTGRQVRVLYQSSSGVYSFISTVLKVQGRLVLLRHSEHVNRSQRRRYFRKPVETEIGIATKKDSTFHPVTTVDMGGGGLSFRSDRSDLKVGTAITIRFYPPIAPENDRARASNALGKIVRLGDDWSVHVQFTTIRDALRDRIISSLFRFNGDSAPTSSSDDLLSEE
ncbi:MAG: PilZ domain-containing protein [Spirochaetaceae bacterium]|nr:MAG: PilZ domain-containing protein [Spirochaetaceae bacterium]